MKNLKNKNNILNKNNNKYYKKMKMKSSKGLFNLNKNKNILKKKGNSKKKKDKNLLKNKIELYRKRGKNRWMLLRNLNYKNN
jgi:hypothetical protein